ncbi:MAG: Rrf2 family transcriptional regulator [Campylobacterota bacterium]|nr:Rrf2 family transcriptional regulator [Campylobacterota bacterium]
MLLTRASEYALLSLIVLAKSDKPLDAETLSNDLGIPKSFLAKILQALAREEIISSFKGAKGGFALNDSSHTRTLLEIMSAVEGKTPTVFDCSPSQESCPSNKASTCTIWPFINRLQGKIDAFLGTLTLEDILEG